MTPMSAHDTRDGSVVRAISLRQSRWPATTWLAVAVAFALPFNSQLPSIGRALWFVCIVALITIPIAARRSGQLPIYPAIWVFAGFASLITVFTATLEGTIAENLFIGAQLLLLLGFGPFAMTASALADPKFTQRVGTAFVVGQSISSTVAIVQLTVGPVLGSEPLQGRAYGLSEHPNSLGYLACIAILISLQLLLNSRSRTWTTGALVINVMALIASGSVSSMMAVCVGFVVLLLVNRNKIGKMIFGAVGCALILWMIARSSAIFTFLPSIGGRYDQVTGQTESVSSWGLRTLTYEFAWSRILENPVVGVGLNPKYSGTFNGVTVTHNVFLRAWYQGGAFLACAVLLVIIAVLIVTVKAVLRKQHGGEVAVLIAIFVFALTSALFEQRHFWLPVLVAWASISAAAVRGRRPALASPVNDQQSFGSRRKPQDFTTAPPSLGHALGESEGEYSRRDGPYVSEPKCED